MRWAPRWERFWRYVPLDKFGPDDCWLWQGGKKAEYGCFCNKAAHRFLYEGLLGNISTGLVLHHKCHQPLCVRPDHLEPVLQRDHLDIHGSFIARRQRETSKTHCKHGHLIDGLNKKGQRFCRKCAMLRHLKWVKKNQERLNRYNLQRYYQLRENDDWRENLNQYQRELFHKKTPEQIERRNRLQRERYHRLKAK